MTNPDFYNWIHRFQGSDYFLMVEEFYDMYYRHLLERRIDSLEHYRDIVKNILEKSDIEPPEKTFWYDAAKQGYTFYRYSNFTEELSGFYVYCILLETVEFILSTGDFFTEDVSYYDLCDFLLMYMKGKNPEFYKDFMAQDVISLTTCLIMAYSRTEKEPWFNEKSHSARNLRSLISLLFENYKWAFDSLNMRLTDKLNEF